MVSKPILDLHMEVCSIWLCREYLSVGLRNPMGYNEDVVSSWKCLSHPTSDTRESF